MRAPSRLARPALATLAALLLLAGLHGYVRLRGGGNPLYWQDPGAIGWRFSAAGSGDVDDGSDAAAVARAFANWEAAPGSRVGFVRQADTLSRDVGADSHLIVFDEDGASGWFPPAGGVVAVTPIRYASSDGRILDADILFNGRDYAFSTDGTPGSFDIQDVATHEIGHFIGLDHAPLPGGSMWPWVAPGERLHRSPTDDDHAGAAALAPRGDPGRLTGNLRDATGEPLGGVQVGATAVADGRLMATALSAVDGDFTLRGLPPGDYQLHVAPVTGAFGSANLAGAPQLRADFAAGFLGGWDSPLLFPVVAGSNTDCGNRQLDADVGLRTAAGAVAQLRPGQAGWVTVPASGAPPGSTLAARAPQLTVLQVQQTASALRAEVAVAAGTAPGTWDLYLRTPGGATAVAAGVLEVVAPPPLLGALSATVGDVGGGDVVQIHGSGFQPGGWVLFGGREVVEPTWIDATTVEVRTPPHQPATVDVVLIRPDGQEARLVDGFRYTVTPRLDSVVPEAGQASGGTIVHLHGAGFGAQTQVRVDGVAVAVELSAPGVLTVRMPAHPAGPAELALENPDAPPAVIPGGFRFIDAPDPVVDSLSPDRGPRDGGTRVTLRGKGLLGTVEVRFGVDPVSGSGGAPAAALEVLGDGSVRATTSGHPGTGRYAVRLTTDSGQGVVVSGFTFQPEERRAGSGCGGTVHGARPADPVSGLLEMLLPFLAWWLTRAPRRDRLRAAACSDASS